MLYKATRHTYVARFIITQNYINEQLSCGAIIANHVYVFLHFHLLKYTATYIKYIYIATLMYILVYNHAYLCVPMYAHVHQCILPVNSMCTLILIAPFTLYKMPYYKLIQTYNLHANFGPM